MDPERRLLFSLSGVGGGAGQARLRLAWIGPRLAAAGGIGYPLSGSLQLGVAESGYGIGGYADFATQTYGIGLGQAGAFASWAWFEQAPGRKRFSLYHRRPLANGWLLLAGRIASKAPPGLWVYWGRELRKGKERLRLWLGFGTPAGSSLRYGARYRTWVFESPVIVEIVARGGLTLAQSGPQARLSLRLQPLVLRAEWGLRWEGGELRVYFPYLLLGEGPGMRFAAGVSGWIALP